MKRENPENSEGKYGINNLFSAQDEKYLRDMWEKHHLSKPSNGKKPISEKTIPVSIVIPDMRIFDLALICQMQGIVKNDLVFDDKKRKVREKPATHVPTETIDMIAGIIPEIPEGTFDLGQDSSYILDLEDEIEYVKPIVVHHAVMTALGILWKEDTLDAMCRDLMCENLTLLVGRKHWLSTYCLPFARIFYTNRAEVEEYLDENTTAKALHFQVPEKYLNYDRYRQDFVFKIMPMAKLKKLNFEKWPLLVSESYLLYNEEPYQGVISAYHPKRKKHPQQWKVWGRNNIEGVKMWLTEP